MFEGHELHQEVDELGAEVARLRGELAAIKNSPTYQLAQGLETAVRGIVSDPDVAMDQITPAIDTAVAEARSAELRRQATPLIKEHVAAVLGTEKEEISRQAAQEAEQVAQSARQHFLETEADDYRAQVRARLSAVATSHAVVAAKGEIAGQVAEELGVPKEALSLLTPETHDALRARTAKIRGETHASKVLQFNQLRLEDILTLVFTQPGKGNVPYSGYQGYDAYTDGVRRLSGKLIDPAEGIFEVTADSWFKAGANGRPMEYSIRPGRKILVKAQNPMNSKLDTVLVKAAPVVFEAFDDGEPVEGTHHDLWYVNLGDFKVLS
jgi:hypothetical protein